MPKINPFLWFDQQAEEAVSFYTAAFGDSKIDSVARYGKLGPGPEGSVMTMGFRLAGQDFAALNGGPVFSFTPALSLFVSCPSEAEIDRLWKGLSESGAVLMELQSYPFSKKFGWVNDRFGLSWQLNLGAAGTSISPFLMFTGAQQGKAEEAIQHYVSIFKDSRVDQLERFAAGEPGQSGSIKHGRFQLGGRQFMAMDSNIEHGFGFTPAISFFVNCDSQDEIDGFWEQLSRGGKEGQCGWLEDRYGVSWQIVPSSMGRWMSSPDAETSQRVTKVLFAMTKLDIAELERAYRG